MDENIVVLKLFLDELGMSPEIRSVADRKRIQKAVYLGQLSGVDLGYRYGWHIMGPYSVSLTRDYYALDEILRTKKSPSKKWELGPSIRRHLREIKGLLIPPAKIDIKQEDWLELLSSVHFLTKISGLKKADTDITIRREKNHLSKYINDGRSALKTYDLI